MKQAIQSMIGDGNGNVSAMRVILIIVVLAVVASKFYNAYLTKVPIAWTTEDWELLTTVVGGKLIQNSQEK